MQRRFPSFQICGTDKILIVFVLFVSTVYVLNMGSSLFSDWIKFIGFISIYFVARCLPPYMSRPGLLGLFSLGMAIVFFLVSISGYGYKNWGHVSTFTAGYFFKTDLAISALILLTFIFSVYSNRLILTIGFLACGYVIYKTNARIALPLIIVIPFITVLIKSGNFKNISLKLLSRVGVAAAIGMCLFLFLDFGGGRMLGFDFSNPFSAANTQGRTVIWSALMRSFSEASLINKLLGMGLSSDILATRFYSESTHLEGVRAHNSYLYLLLSVGILGSFIFYYLLYSTYSKLFTVLRTGLDIDLTVAAISTSLMIMFLWLSLTTEIIIRAQLMVPLFFFAGLHVNAFLKSRAV
jgi:hypothetical protein